VLFSDSDELRNSVYRGLFILIHLVCPHLVSSRVDHFVPQSLRVFDIKVNLKPLCLVVQLDDHLLHLEVRGGLEVLAHHDFYSGGLLPLGAWPDLERVGDRELLELENRLFQQPSVNSDPDGEGDHAKAEEAVFDGGSVFSKELTELSALEFRDISIVERTSQDTDQRRSEGVEELEPEFSAHLLKAQVEGSYKDTLSDQDQSTWRFLPALNVVSDLTDQDLRGACASGIKLFDSKFKTVRFVISSGQQLTFDE
jgi:hypothetical protein